MEFTGERFIPSLDGQIKYEHLHRYALCLDFVAGKSVLDIASGEGYGSMLLSRVASSVTGVDIDTKSVEHASQQYSDFKNISFLVGSCDSVPLADRSIEVVTSFETIEHHDKHNEMMLEIKRVLKPSGLLIISSPNRLTYSDEPKQINPFHVKELYYDELDNLLKQHFKYVRIYGQRLATGSFIFPLNDPNECSFRAYTGGYQRLENQVCDLKSPIYFVAICSDELESIRKTLDSVYIDSSDDLYKLFEVNFHRTTEISGDFKNKLEHTKVDLEQAKVELEHAKVELEHAKVELDKVKNIVLDEESGKFWKLRSNWTKLEQILGENKSQ
jgi:ubiquinone/menaquinone biosynthesis C-methylase UbiE